MFACYAFESLGPTEYVLIYKYIDKYYKCGLWRAMKLAGHLTPGFVALTNIILVKIIID